MRPRVCISGPTNLMGRWTTSFSCRMQSRSKSSRQFCRGFASPKLREHNNSDLIVCTRMNSVLQAQALRASPRLDDNDKALALLERAIALQPNYALAHALSAACYTDRYMVGNVTDFELVRAKAMHHIQKAIELDNDDAEVLVHAAITIGIFDDSERGTAMAERAVNLNVNSAQGWFALGAGAMYLGDHARAFYCEARALRLNPAGPLRVQAMSIMAMSHFLLGQHNEAHVWAERAYQEFEFHRGYPGPCVEFRCYWRYATCTYGVRTVCN